MALAGEAGEVLELFQWLTDEESLAVMHDEKKASALRDELADVLIYLLRLSDVLGVDIEAAVKEKLRKNADRYPSESVYGKATKYTDL